MRDLFREVPEDIAWRLVAAGDLPSDPGHILTEAELGLRDSFGHPDRRRSFTAGRVAARLLLADRLALPCREVPLAVEAGGGLAVPGHDISVSISHAGRGARARSIAAIGGRPLGVDVEEVVPRRSDLYRRILHPEEYSLLDSFGLEHNEAQLLFWSLKEAVLKAMGTGFQRPPKSIRLRDLRDGAGRARVEGGAVWSLRYARLGGFWTALAFRV